MTDLEVRPATDGDPPCSCGRPPVSVIETDHGNVSCCHEVSSGREELSSPEPAIEPEAEELSSRRDVKGDES